MSVDPAVMEAPTQTEVVAPTEGRPGMAEAFEMMREELRATTPGSQTSPAEPTESETEPPQSEGETPPEGEPEQPPDQKAPSSRRAKTVEKVKTEAEQTVKKVKTEAEQKVADAEAARVAAEQEAAELRQKLQEREQAPTREADAARQAQLEAEYGAWLGTPEEYAEAVRWSRMDNADPNWDFDRHQKEVARLNTFDERRRWAAATSDKAKGAGRAEALGAISNDFLVTLAEDLPEDKREAYRKHEGGIPGAVRFYAETIMAPKIEELEGKIAEQEAEIARLRPGGGTSRSPVAGGARLGGTQTLDYAKQTPEELMAAELRQQAAAANGRRR